MENLDIARYADHVGPADRGYSAKRNAYLNNRFPPAQVTDAGDPTVFIDRFGREVGWYLPEILTPERQVSLWPNAQTRGKLTYVVEDRRECDARSALSRASSHPHG